MHSVCYKVGDIFLLTSKLAIQRGEDEIELQEIPYRILLFIVTRSHRAPGVKIGIEEIAHHIWPEWGLDSLDLKKRIHSHIRILRASGVDFLSKGTHGGYLIQGEVTEVLLPQPEDQVSIRLTLKSLIFVSVLTSAVTLAVTTFVRGFLTAFGTTLTQAPQFGFVSGFFQAVFGSLAWSIPLSVVLLRGWVNRVTFEEWHAKLRFPAQIGFGALAGAIGGLCVDIALMFAQQRKTLFEAHWTLSPESSPWSIFTTTSLGYAEPAIGIAVGTCCAALLSLSLGSQKWKDLLLLPLTLGSLTDLLRLLGMIFRNVALWTLLLIEVPVMAVGAACYFKFHSSIPLNRFLGEAFIIATAGVAFTTAMLASIYALVKGFRITSD